MVNFITAVAYIYIYHIISYLFFLSFHDYNKIFMLDRVRKIFKMFPNIPVPHNLREDDDMQELTNALGAAKTRVEGCSSFLKAAIRLDSMLLQYQ